MINLKNMAVLLFSLVVPGLAIAQTEVLYNGIHLPEQWTPRFLSRSMSCSRSSIMRGSRRQARVRG